jgi:hypothetical protein
VNSPLRITKGLKVKPVALMKAAELEWRYQLRKRRGGTKTDKIVNPIPMNQSCRTRPGISMQIAT